MVSQFKISWFEASFIPQPILKLIRIQPLRYQPFSSLPSHRSPVILMLLWILHQTLHFPPLRVILAFANNPCIVCSLGENVRSSLVAMSNTDLEGVVVEPSN